PTALYLRWDVVLSTTQPKSAIEDVFLFVREDMVLEIEQLDADAPQRRIGEILADLEYVGIDAIHAALEQQQRQHQPIGQLLVDAGQVTPEKVGQALAEQRHLRQQASSPKPAGAASVRVPAERLDELMDRVGELVIAQSRLHQIAGTSADQRVTSVAEE